MWKHLQNKLSLYSKQRVIRFGQSVRDLSLLNLKEKWAENISNVKLY